MLILITLIPPRQADEFNDLKYFTDVSCLVKFSVAVAVAVTFINLCAGTSHVVGDVVIIFILVVNTICLLILIQSLLIPILLITSKG